MTARKAEPKLTDKEIVAQYNDLEPCSHGTRFWCEDCVNESYLYHSAHATETAFKLASDELTAAAGALWVQDKTSEAETLKRWAKHFATKVAAIREKTAGGLRPFMERYHKERARDDE